MVKKPKKKLKKPCTYKEGKLKSGKGGIAVKSRDQAIAIGLSKAREEGAKVPKQKK